VGSKLSSGTIQGEEGKAQVRKEIKASQVAFIALTKRKSCLGGKKKDFVVGGKKK